MTMKEELIFFLMFFKVIFQMIDTLKSKWIHHYASQLLLP